MNDWGDLVDLVFEELRHRWRKEPDFFARRTRFVLESLEQGSLRGRGNPFPPGAGQRAFDVNRSSSSDCRKRRGTEAEPGRRRSDRVDQPRSDLHHFSTTLLGFSELSWVESSHLESNQDSINPYC
jgi:hypothetical protein